jgi:hypothetical protein
MPPPYPPSLCLAGLTCSLPVPPTSGRASCSRARSVVLPAPRLSRSCAQRVGRPHGHLEGVPPRDACILSLKT